MADAGRGSSFAQGATSCSLFKWYPRPRIAAMKSVPSFLRSLWIHFDRIAFDLFAPSVQRFPDLRAR